MVMAARMAHLTFLPHLLPPCQDLAQGRCPPWWVCLDFLSLLQWCLHQFPAVRDLVSFFLCCYVGQWCFAASYVESVWMRRFFIRFQKFSIHSFRIVFIVYTSTAQRFKNPLHKAFSDNITVTSAFFFPLYTLPICKRKDAYSWRAFWKVAFLMPCSSFMWER